MDEKKVVDFGIRKTDKEVGFISSTSDELARVLIHAGLDPRKPADFLQVIEILACLVYRLLRLSERFNKDEIDSWLKKLGAMLDVYVFFFGDKRGNHVE